MMPRNLHLRVEAMVLVEDPRLQGRLAEILQTNLADDGTGHKVLEERGPRRPVPVLVDDLDVLS